MSPRNVFQHNQDTALPIEVITLPPPPAGARYEWEMQDDESIKIRLVEK